MTKENITTILKNTFADDCVEVIDTNGNQDHFNILVISDKFESMSLINRHRLIYQQLQKFLSNEIQVISFEEAEKISFDFQISLMSLPRYLRIKNTNNINFYKLAINEKGNGNSYYLA